MAVCRVVVDTALRKLGVLASGREARSSDAADTLTALQGLYTSWIAAGTFGRLIDVTPQGSSYTPYCSARVFRESETTLDVLLPELVGYGWFYDYGWYRCCGQYNPTVTPRDGMAVVISDTASGETASWLYDGTIKKWQGIEGLTLDDEAPRSTADLLGLASCLALEISDQFPTDIAPATAVQANRYMTAMTQRFGMRRETIYLPEAYL